MADVPCIIAEVTFLSAEAGGRRSLPMPPWGSYMPHAVVNEEGEYLGIRFLDGPVPQVGVAGEYRLALGYYPTVDYTALQPGICFTLREGARVVATGRVLRWGQVTPRG